MRYLLLVLVALQFLSAEAQRPESMKAIKRFKQMDDYILITTKDHIDSSFNKLLRMASSSGFAIAVKNDSQRYFRTEFKTSKGLSIRIRGRLKSEKGITKAFMYSEVKNSGAIEEAYVLFDIWASKAREKLWNNRAFALLYEFAEQYRGGTLSAGGGNSIELDRNLPVRTRIIRIKTGLSKKENLALIDQTLRAYKFGGGTLNDSTRISKKFFLKLIKDPEEESPEFTFMVTASDKAIAICGVLDEESILTQVFFKNFSFYNSSVVAYDDLLYVEKSFRVMLNFTDYLGSFELEFSGKKPK